MDRNKKIFIAVVIVSILAYLFYSQVYKKYINPETDIEAFQSENGKYLYVVEIYGKYNEKKHLIKKIDLKNDKIIWKKNFKRHFALNHQVRKNKPAIFFDSKNIYYYIEGRDDKFFLIGFNKKTGENIFDINVNEQLNVEKISSFLFAQYVNLKDRIILLNKTRSSKDEEWDYSFTIVNKNNGQISTMTLPQKGLTIQEPLGNFDENTDYLILQSGNFAYIFNKNNFKKYKIIETKGPNNYLDGNNFYYFKPNLNFVRKNLETGKIDFLFKDNDLTYPYFKIYNKKNIIVHQKKYTSNRKGRDDLLKCYGLNGKFKWKYDFPKNYSFRYHVAMFNFALYMPENTPYYKVDNNYFPFLIKIDVNEEQVNKKIVMLNVKTGKPLWDKDFINIESISFVPSNFYKEGDYYYFIKDNKLTQIDSITGKIEKTISVKYKHESSTENLISRYDLKSYQFVKNYLFIQPRYRHTIIRVDLKNDDLNYIGNKLKGSDFVLEVKK